MLASYHVHTAFSDGQASLDEMIEAAIEQNVTELGISDHFAMEPRGRTYSWSLPRDGLPAYFAQLDAARTSYADRIMIRRGLEMDWFPGHGDAISAFLDPYRAQIDYLIGAVHFVGDEPVDGSPKRWERETSDQRNETHRTYWRLIAEMAQSAMFDIIAHIDLPKKFGYLPTIDLSPEIDAALDAIASTSAVVEINTAGWHKPIADAYPTLDILQRCHDRDIPVTLSSDAHRPQDILRDFRAAAERLREAGYRRVGRVGDGALRYDLIDDATVGLEVGQLSYDRDPF